MRWVWRRCQNSGRWRLVMTHCASVAWRRCWKRCWFLAGSEASSRQSWRHVYVWTVEMGWCVRSYTRHHFWLHCIHAWQTWQVSSLQSITVVHQVDPCVILFNLPECRPVLYTFKSVTSLIASISLFALASAFTFSSYAVSIKWFYSWFYLAAAMCLIVNGFDVCLQLL